MPTVSFSPAARADLRQLYDLIFTEGGARRAEAYLARIERRCSALEVFPEAGQLREDVAPGLRTLAFERRILLAYRVVGDDVRIARILYAGRALPSSF